MRYRALLKALTFPLQLLVRHERLDLLPYLARLQEHPEVVAPSWGILAEELALYLRKLGSQRTLIASHFYLIVPAPEPGGSSPGLTAWRRRSRVAHTNEMLAHTLQELAIRIDMVQSQLRALGLRTEPLRGMQLARFYHSCLVPERALTRPLTDAHLMAVGRPLKVKGQPQKAAPQGMPHDPLVSAAPVEILPPSSDHGADDNLVTLQVVSENGEDAEKIVRRIIPPRRTSRRFPRPRHAPRRDPRPSRVPAKPHTRSRRKKKAEPQLLPPPDLLRLADLLAPGSLEETREAVCLDGEWVRGIAITAFPREVSSSGWLAPLLLHDGILDIVMHLHPQDQATMLRQLKRRRSGYASTTLVNRRQGRLDDPEMDVAQQDVTRLMSRLASGEERIFEVTQAIYQRRVRRALYIDEAASLIEHAEGGTFLANLSRRARKRYLRLVVMTQNPEAFVEDKSGGVVAANAAIKILKLQDRTSVKAVTERFGLTPGETQMLLTLRTQEALVLAGDRRVIVQSSASQREHDLITTNPVELAQRTQHAGWPTAAFDEERTVL
jgi:hypothetical protein